PYVLRYWETEFKRDIRPERTRSNQRMYRRRDVQTFLEIKRLRYEEKLEVGGARKRLRRPRRDEGGEERGDGAREATSAEVRVARTRRAPGRPRRGGGGGA